MPVRNNRCKHGLVMCSRCVVVTDAARRMSDAINLMVTLRGWDDLRNGYMAFNLGDGSTNAVLYDSYEDAVRHTWEPHNAYFCFRQAMGGVNPVDCQIFLNFWRYAKEAGIPTKTPDERRMISPILSVYGHDVMRGRIDP